MDIGSGSSCYPGSFAEYASGSNERLRTSNKAKLCQLCNAIAVQLISDTKAQYQYDRNGNLIQKIERGYDGEVKTWKLLL